MKLKNKKTGKIGYPYFQNWKEITCVIVDENAKPIAEYTSLAELNEEWEDAPEEPKEYWFINEFGTPTKADFVGRETLYDKCRKNFGNYFETKEEAEKAVEKLKAWKRLKDKGFRFEGVRTIGKVIDFDMPIGYYRAYCDEQFSNEKSLELFNDLNLLFGGKE